MLLNRTAELGFHDNYITAVIFKTWCYGRGITDISIQGMSAHTQVLYHLFETRLFTVGYHTAGLGVHTTGFGAPGQVEWFIPYLRSLQEG